MASELPIKNSKSKKITDKELINQSSCNGKLSKSSKKLQHKVLIK